MTTKHHQLVQKTAVGVFTKSVKLDHIILALMSLHRLHVHKRAEFFFLNYCLKLTEPSYVSSLIVPYNLSHALHSLSAGYFIVSQLKKIDHYTFERRTLLKAR